MNTNNDGGYKNLFSNPKMIEDLLTGFVIAEWVNELDFTTLEKLNNEFITDNKLKKRSSDVVWKVRHQKKDEWFYIYLLLEFQSKPDPKMALRIMVYLGLLYLELYESKQFVETTSKDKKQRKLPPVLPLVLYNGKTRWKAATDVDELIIESPLGLEPYRPNVSYLLIDEGEYANHELETVRNAVSTLFQLENTPELENTFRILHDNADYFEGRHGLQRVFSTWLSEVLFPSRYPEVKPPNIDLFAKERNTVLAETVKNYYDEAEAKGFVKGKAKGFSEGEAKGLIKGEEKGEARGKQKGKAESLVFILEKKFEPLNEVQRGIIFNLNDDQLMEAMAYIFQAENLEKMFRFIQTFKSAE